MNVEIGEFSFGDTRRYLVMFMCGRGRGGGVAFGNNNINTTMNISNVIYIHM